VDFGTADYVAISHVWSDGLGNPIVHPGGLPVNGLAECQVLRLNRFLKNLRPKAPVMFWMDTFCIPAQAEYEEQRKAAISKMRTIYEKASKVLVLDAELLQACAHVSNFELMMRVLTCGWMRRVWTLQEGVLNDATYIQFKDAAIKPNELEEWNRHDLFVPPRGQRLFMINEIDKRWHQMRNVYRLPSPRNLAYIYNAFQFRRIARAKDETVCLAILAGLETRTITEIGRNLTESDLEIADRRMKEFLRLCQSIPLDFLFLGSERFEEDGYRWAPKSFLRHRIDEDSCVGTDSLSGEFVQVQADAIQRTGLYCNHGGFLLYMPQLGPGEGVNHTFLFYCQVDNSWYTVSNPEYFESKAVRRTINNLKCPALLCKSGLGISALVDITDEADGRKIAKYIAQVGCFLTPPELIKRRAPTLKEPGKFYSKVDENGMHVILHGERLGEDHRWCIY
jgi:hypothetical protein